MAATTVLSIGSAPGTAAIQASNVSREDALLPAQLSAPVEISAALTARNVLRRAGANRLAQGIANVVVTAAMSTKRAFRGTA